MNVHSLLSSNTKNYKYNNLLKPFRLAIFSIVFVEIDSCLKKIKEKKQVSSVHLYDWYIPLTIDIQSKYS